MPRLDLRDQLLRFSPCAAYRPSPCTQQYLSPAVVARLLLAALPLRGKCAPSVRPGRPAVVEDAASCRRTAPRALAAPASVEALTVAVDLVVAQLHRKGVDLLRASSPSSQSALMRASSCRRHARSVPLAGFPVSRSSLFLPPRHFPAAACAPARSTAPPWPPPQRSCKLMSSHSTAKAAAVAMQCAATAGTRVPPPA